MHLNSNDLIAALTAQRDNALNDNARLSAVLASKNRQIDALQKQLEEASQADKEGQETESSQVSEESQEAESDQAAEA